MENPEKLATLGTQDIGRAKQMFYPTFNNMSVIS